MCMYGKVPSLFTWNCHNIVDQLHFNIKQRFFFFLMVKKKEKAKVGVRKGSQALVEQTLDGSTSLI